MESQNSCVVRSVVHSVEDDTYEELRQPQLKHVQRAGSRKLALGTKASNSIA